MGWEPQSDILCCRAQNPTSPNSATGWSWEFTAKPPQAINANTWILSFKPSERGTWQHGHNCSVAVKTSPKPKTLWKPGVSEQVWASQISSRAWMTSFLHWTIKATVSYWQLLLKLDSNFIMLNMSEKLFWNLQMRMDGSTVLSAVRMLITTALFSMPYKYPPRG